MSLIFHITTRSHWQQAQQVGIYRTESLYSEGFIHCSTPTQITWVADTFYRQQSELVLLGIDPEQLEAELRFEDVGNGQMFPHLYGPLNLNAVVQVIDFEPNSDGRFTLPEAIQHYKLD